MFADPFVSVECLLGKSSSQGNSRSHLTFNILSIGCDSPSYIRNEIQKLVDRGNEKAKKRPFSANLTSSALSFMLFFHTFSLSLSFK